MNGWIKLHRCLTDNKFWLNEPFSKGQAWVDLLLRINYEDGTAIIGSKSIIVSAGQTLWSMQDMSLRWKWSRKKVRNFLVLLKMEHQIDFLSTTKYTLITIENWEFYQNEFKEGTSKNEKGNIKGTSKEHQKNTIKNIKKDKEIKEDIYIDLHFIDDVIDKVKITQEQYDKLVAKFNKELVHKNIVALDNYICNGKGSKYKDHYRALNTWCNKSDNIKSENQNTWEGMREF